MLAGVGRSGGGGGLSSVVAGGVGRGCGGGHDTFDVTFLTLLLFFLSLRCVQVGWCDVIFWCVAFKFGVFTSRLYCANFICLYVTLRRIFYITLK